MSCFILPEGLELLRHGSGAPLWRALVSLENCVAVNAVCFAVLLACVGFVAKKMCFWYEPFENLQTNKKDTPLPHSRFAPFLAVVSFAVVPQFAEKVTRLSPFLLSMTPVFLSAAVVASLNSRPTPPEEPNAVMEDDRRFVWLRLALAGALAAVGAWESPYGIVLAPGLLAITWFPFILRDRSVSAVSVAWVLGFMAVFLVEPEVLPHCPWSALSMHWVQLSGILVFSFVCAVPLALVRRLGENRLTILGWMTLLLVVATVTVTDPARFALQSASERFVRQVLADVGDRKLLIGDGVFDVMFDEFKPADVKRIGTKTVEDREFLVNLIGNGEPITNRILVVDRHYGFGEMAQVSDEVGVGLEPTDARNLSEAERTKSAAARRTLFAKQMMPILESLNAMGKGFEDIPESLRKEEVATARESIRNGWRQGICGPDMSTTLLALDMLCGDVRALEADAVTALSFDREDVAANAALGSLRLRDGRLDLAEKYLKRGVKGEGPMAMGDYARLLVCQGKFAEAERWARRAIAKLPNDWRLRQPLAAVLIETGRPDEARRELDEIRRLAVAAGRAQSVDAFLSGANRRLAECKDGGRTLTGSGSSSR